MSDCMAYKGYFTKVEYSKEDNSLIGRIEGITDLISFCGDSLAEFREAFEGSVDDYLALCEEIGKEPNKPYSGQFNVRIDKELHRKASIKASECGMSLNKYVETAIKEKVEGGHIPQYAITLKGDDYTAVRPTIRPYNVQWVSGAVHM